MTQTKFRTEQIEALAAGDITSGTFADARISESSVTQHQGALSITESQISDLSHYTSSDFDTDFSGKSTTDLSEGTSLYFTDERAQDAVGTIFTDSAEIDFTYTDATPSISASLVAGSIDETKLDTSVNASLDLADSALQNVVEDTSPQLGGNLSLNGNLIGTSSSYLDVLDGIGDSYAVEIRKGGNNRDVLRLSKASSGAGDYIQVTQEDSGVVFNLADGGIIDTGTWQATDVGVAHGGTGASTASAARTNLGLAIGSDVQAWDTDLDTWATKTAPSGTVIGTTDTQTLTNKRVVANVRTETSSTTLVLTDDIVEVNSASSNTVTIPPNSSVAFPVGTKILITQLGAGSTTVTAGSGVTLNNPSSVAAEIGEEEGARGIYKRATDTWQLI